MEPVALVFATAFSLTALVKLLNARSCQPDSRENKTISFGPHASLQGECATSTSIWPGEVYGFT